MSDASEDLLEAFPTRRPDRSSQVGDDPEDIASKCRTSPSAHSRKTRRKGGLSRNRSERFRRHRSYDDVTDITNGDSKNLPGTHGLVKRRYHNGIITVVDGFNLERGCQPTRDQTLVDFSDHNRTNSNLEMAESAKSGSVDDSGGEVVLSPSVPLKHATSASSLPGTIDASSGARSLSSVDVDPNPIDSAEGSRQESSTVISTTSSTDKDNTKVGTSIPTETEMSPNGANHTDSLESESDEEESSFEEETSSSEESSSSCEESQSRRCRSDAESAANVIVKEFNTHDQTMNISDFDEDEINKSVTTAESDNTPITSRKQCSNDAKESFTADSPYFTAYVDREMGNLNVLTDTLRDISARARGFGECGALMADATRKLSLSCKLHPTYDDPALDEETREREKYIVARRKESVGQEMGSVLRILGEVLDEIADAQSQMCESLEASLSLTLDAFANVESEESTRLRSEADLMSASSEAQFAKYLQRGVKVTSSSNDARVNGVTDEINAGVAAVSSNWNKLSDSLSLKGWSNRDGRDINDRNKRGNSRTPFGASNGSGSGTASTSSDSNNVIHTAVAASSIRQMLEEIRLSQANSELKRFQLLKRLESLKTRRNFELGESALASLNGIRAYFHHCSDLTQGLAPRLKRAHVGQIDAREKHDAQQVPWDMRQKGLTNAISEVGVAAANAGVIADAISRGQATGFGASMIADQPTTLAEIENEVQLWDLPRLLAESSFYHREPTPGVSVEGWLYKRSTNRISTSWNKRWFIVDKTGVYYLREGQRSSGANSSSRERIKVCDILICTVREVPENAKGNQGCRFCFEILSPNSRPHMLQACGPIEFKRWVNGIRNCIECQLVSGNLPPAGLLPKSSQRRVDSSLESVEKADLESPGNYGEESFVDLLQSSVMLNSTEKGSHPSSQSNASKGFFPAAGNPNNKSVNAAGQNIKTTALARKPLVQEILNANSYCADCGKPSPDWASLNLGVLLCIECSGVHRSMGVHVSKVRSVTLDELTESEARLLLIIGNERANKIWEAGVYSQTGWNKPDPSDDRKKKEDWIKSKYQWSGFLDYKKEDGAGEEREKKFSMDLYEAAKAGHILGVAEALAKGGNVEWKNELEGSKTPLHICAVGIDDSHDTDEVVDETDTNEGNDKKLRKEKRSFDRIACAELLLQNGAKLDAQDKSHHGVLDCAMCGNAERYMIEYLTSKTKSV